MSVKFLYLLNTVLWSNAAHVGFKPHVYTPCRTDSHKQFSYGTSGVWPEGTAHRVGAVYMRERWVSDILLRCLLISLGTGIFLLYEQQSSYLIGF